jgi:hypothetical protein
MSYQPAETHNGNRASQVSLEAPAAISAQPTRTDIFFVDGQLESAEQIVQGLPEGAEVFILNPAQNGIAQMAAYLAGREGIDSITLISHGSPGAVQAGSAWLSAHTMQDHRSDLERIGQSLAADGDLLLYGCKVAEGGQGQALLDTIASITGADVSGSTDNTGAAHLGGNWALERSTGPVEAYQLSAAAGLGGYANLLGAATVQIFDTVILNDGQYTYVPPGQAANFEGWTFSVIGRDGSIDPGSALAFTNDASLTGLANNASDKALVLQGAYDNSVGQAAAVLKSTDGGKFSFKSVTVENFQSSGDDYALVGYRDGQAVDDARQTFQTASNMSGGIIVSVSGRPWEYLDEVRIVRAGGQTDISLSIDDVFIGAAVPPSTAPVISDIGGDVVSATERGPAVALDAGGDALVTDTDSANFAGGLLSVNIITNRSVTYDSLVVIHQGNAAGQIGVSGNTVSYGGVAFATFSGGTGNDSMDFALNSNATPAAVQALMRTVGFLNSHPDDPVKLTRTISYSLTDGGGGTSPTYTSQVQFNAINDAPTLTGTGLSPTFTEGGSRVNLFNISAASTVEQGQGFTSFGLQITNVNDGSSESLAIDGSTVALFSGNTVGSTANNGLQVSVSVAAGVATVTVLASSSLVSSTLRTVLNGISYSNASENPSTGSRVASITFLKDNGGTANGGADTAFGLQSSTVTVLSVNDAPVVTTSGGPVVFTAGDNTASTPVAIDAGLTVSDVDTGTLAYATVAITGNLRIGEDQLVFVNNNAALYGNITASYNAATGEMTLASAGSTATVAQWQAALRTVRYTDTAITPNASTRTVSFTLNDGTSNSNAPTRTIQVVPVDQTPLLNLTGGSASFTEGQSPVKIDPGLMVSDLDNGTLAAATVQVSQNYRSGEDVLQFTNTSSASYGNIVGSFSTATGTLTLASAGSTANLAQWQAALRDVSYSNSSQSPHTDSRTISFSVNDGVKSSAVGTKGIDVTAVNDDPALANPLADQTAPEDAAFSFVIPLNAFADADTGDTLTYSAQLSNGDALPAWLSFDPATRTFSGTPANADVGTLVITVSASDGHGAPATDTFSITVANTNDAPTLHAPLADKGATAGSVFNFQVAANTFTDVDLGDTLSFSARLDGGAALPSWLHFDPVTRSFSGTPAAGDVGVLDIEVVAADSQGATAADTFRLVVSEQVFPPDPVAPPSAIVDGVPVTTAPGPGGSTIITVPVVQPTRLETPGSKTPLADIPIATGPSGQPVVSVGVPNGVGLTAEGLANSTSGSAALAELGLRIERVTGPNTELTNAGNAFYATLAAGEQLNVQILKPTIGPGYDGSQPLVINGSTNAADGKQAIIIDARSLPGGTVIQVENIDFVAVVGDVRVIGGAGQNIASGDGGAQWIVLGPDDDVIHGGAGNDVVGSEAGDDQVFGDAGNDTVFGGAGNDMLSGGTGSDRLNGGTGFDVALQEGKGSDYAVTLDGAGIKLTHTASGVSDWLVDVEQVRFETGPALTIAHSAAQEAAAYLFTKWLGRDLGQGEGAAIQGVSGWSAEQVASAFAQLFPTQTAGKTAAQLLDGMPSAAAIRVDAVREVTVTGDAGNNVITPTLGLARYVDGGAGIDTLVIPAALAQTRVQHGADGSYTLQRMTDGAMLDATNVERVTFTDTRLALDLHGHAGEAARLLGALAGPAALANKGLVGEVIRMLDAGLSSQAIAGAGLQILGAGTPTQIAQTLWTNVAGRAGNTGELKVLTDILASGVSGAELAVMAAHLDATAARIDLVGLAASGIEFA